MKAVIITQISPEEFQSLLTSSIKNILNESKFTEQSSNLLEPLYTRDEAAKYLQIDLSTLNRWTKKGTIQSFGIGNRVYYKLEDIKKALIKL